MIKYIIKMLSRRIQRRVVLAILEDVVKCNDSSIDKMFTERILTLVAKSNGNNFTSFTMDK